MRGLERAAEVHRRRVELLALLDPAGGGLRNLRARELAPRQHKSSAKTVHEDPSNCALSADKERSGTAKSAKKKATPV